MKKLVSRVNRFAGVVAGWVVLIPMLMTLYEVVARNAFNSPSFFTVEMGGYFLVFIIFVPLGDVLSRDGYPRMLLFYVLLGSNTKKIVDTILGFLTFLAISLLLVLSIQLVIDTYSSGRVSTILRLPMWPIMLIMPIGLTVLAAQQVVELYQKIEKLGFGGR